MKQQRNLEEPKTWESGSSGAKSLFLPGGPSSCQIWLPVRRALISLVQRSSKKQTRDRSNAQWQSVLRSALQSMSKEVEEKQMNTTVQIGTCIHTFTYIQEGLYPFKTTTLKKT